MDRFLKMYDLCFVIDYFQIIIETCKVNISRNNTLLTQTVGRVNTLVFTSTIATIPTDDNNTTINTITLGE